jgi:hypothetical protein
MTCKPLLIAFAACAVLCLALAIVHADGCPDLSRGWSLYPENHPAPDFVTEGVVQLQEARFCDRGVYLFFVSEQADQLRRTCFVVTEPTFDLYLDHLPADSVPDDARLGKLEQQLAADRSLFHQRMASLRALLGATNTNQTMLRFRTGPFSKPPRLYFGSPSSVRWKGKSTELLGVFDVYFGR